MEIRISLSQLFVLLFVLLTINSCKNNNSTESEGDSISAIVSIPVGPDQLIDTANAARLVFEETIMEWDTLKMGEKFHTVFKYRNTGNRPAIISDVEASCGCTGVSYTTAPIQPGDEGEIKVTFDSTGKLGYQKKSINVIGNTFPSRTLLYLQGFVEK